MTSKVPILLYHDLESPEFPSEKVQPAARGTVVDAGRFELQMAYLVQRGYRTLTLEEYFRFRIQGVPQPFGSIIITFDDGHYSHFHLAVPILQKYGLKASFFIIAGRLDQRFHVTRSQLRRLADNGMEIGSHGLSHTYLPFLNRDETRREISESKRILEEVSGSAVNYFAFPGGHYTRRAIEALPEFGYKGACSCLQGLNGMNTSPWRLKRIEVRGAASVEDFTRLFNPKNLLFYQFVDIWKRLIRHSVGLHAYITLRSRLYRYYRFKR